MTPNLVGGMVSLVFDDVIDLPEYSRLIMADGIKYGKG